MFLGNVLIGSLEATFQDGEITFNGVGVSIATDVFTNTVTDYAMTGELTANLGVLTSFISHKGRVFFDLFFDDGFQGFGINSRNMVGTGAAVTLNQCENLFLVA